MREELVDQIIEEFEVVDEAGNVFTVVKSTPIGETKLLSGEEVRRRRLPSFFLSDGRPLTQRETGVFEILETGEIIRARE